MDSTSAIGLGVVVGVALSPSLLALVSHCGFSWNCYEVRPGHVRAVLESPTFGCALERRHGYNEALWDGGGVAESRAHMRLSGAMVV